MTWLPALLVNWLTDNDAQEHKSLGQSSHPGAHDGLAQDDHRQRVAGAAQLGRRVGNVGNCTARGSASAGD